MTVENLEFEIAQTGESAAKSLDSLAQSVKNLSKALTPKALERFAGRIKDFSDALNQIDGSTVSRIERLGAAMSQLSAIKGTVGITKQDANNLKNLSDAAGMFGTTGMTAATATRELGRAARKTKTPVQDFLSSLSRIAKYRILRTIIKEITQAFSEGLKNAYLFSQGITTEGHRFSVAMDRMKSASTQMKNQLGSALIGLLTAAEPILLSLIDLTTRAADAVAQFFAAFTGSTYLKAIKVNDKFAESATSASKAIKEYKNQLLAFDEINKLTEPTDTGSGSGSTELNPSYMFKDSPINEKILEIVGKVKDIVKEIDPYVSSIGVGLATWVIASSFITSLSTVALLAGGVASGFSLITGFIGSMKDKLDFTNLNKMLGGSVGLVTALGIAFGPLGATIGAVASAALHLASGLKNALQEGNMTEPVMYALATTIGLIGIAAAPATSGLSLLAAAAGIATLYITSNWKTIKDKTVEVFEKHVVPIIDGVKEDITDFGETLHQIFVVPFEKALDEIKRLFSNFNLPHIKLPHIEITWSSAGWLAQQFGISSIPHFNVNWYAKGGIIDGATLIGAGEAGAEAIVPLEKNTGWMDMVADRLSTNMDNSGMSDDILLRILDKLSDIYNKDTDITLDGITLARQTWKYNKQVQNEHGVSLVTIG